MSSFKFYLRNYRSTGILLGSLLIGAITFQAIILTIIYNLNIGITLENPDSIYLTVSGLDALITVFIFAMACGNFKPSFNMQMQNSVSRKTQFRSLLLSGVAFCGAASLIHTVAYAIANPAFNSFYLNNFKFADASAGLTYEMFGSYYHSLFYAPNDLTFSNLVWTFLLMFTDCIIGYLFGYICANISYRLPNDLVRVAVFAAPIILLFIVFPVIDSTFFNGVVYESIYIFLDFIMGYDTFEAWKNVCTNIVFSAILAVIFYFILRKTPVKK